MIIANQIAIYPRKDDNDYWIQIDITDGRFEISDSKDNSMVLDMATLFNKGNDKDKPLIMTNTKDEIKCPF